MRVLFIHNHRTTFIAQDIDCLRQHFEVQDLCLPSRLMNPLSIWRKVAAYDLVFGWFASWHTFLPMLFARILGKPSALVIGGYDLANLPEIGYGHQRGGVKKYVSRATMRLAGALITNSHYSEREARQNAGVCSQVIYHGIPDSFSTAKPKERLAITIGNVDRANLWRKGVEPFVRAAALLPDVRFVVIGAWKDDAIDHLRSIASKNVEFTGWVDRETVHDFCSRAAVYVQASRHEGFGMAVAEAMLGGCIPVVTRAGALPEVAGDCGVYIDAAEPVMVAKAIAKAFAHPDTCRTAGRERILRQFPMTRRQAALIDVLLTLNPAQPTETRVVPGSLT